MIPRLWRVKPDVCLQLKTDNTAFDLHGLEVQCRVRGLKVPKRHLAQSGLVIFQENELARKFRQKSSEALTPAAVRNDWAGPGWLEEKQVKEIGNSAANSAKLTLKAKNRGGFGHLPDLLEQVCLCHGAILSCV